MERDQLKLKRLQDISDEVKEMHPLLEALFKRLPGIERVERKHGPNEMGADFVLHKKDDVLGDMDYVGVIAKVQSIKQDHSDVERQIKECTIERLIDNGKKKIYLTEIWVITLGSISNNAQVKIHSEHKTTKIKFFDINRLFSLIDKYYVDFWVDVSVQAGEYLRKIRATAESMSPSVAGFSAKTTGLIERDLQAIAPESKYSNKSWKPKRSRIDQVLATEKFILIEATMGSGKSTLLGDIAKKQADNETYNSTGLLPILTTVAEINNKYNSDVTALIKAILDDNSLPPPTGYIILIDAFDELKIETDARIEIIKKLFDSASKQQNVRLVLASRPADDPALSALVRKNFSVYNLCPLSIKQILKLIGDICGSSIAEKKLSRDIEKSHVFRALPRTPISALLLARLLKENVQEIPSSMTELYSKYMELVLGRWDMTKGLQSQIEYDVLSNVVADLGRFSITNNLVDIPIGDVCTHIQEYVDTRNLKIDKEAALQLLLSKKDIFIFNHYKKTVYFAHRTFAEFFFATSMQRNNDAKIGAHIFDAYWANSYFFYIGLRRDCPDLIDEIEAIQLVDEGLRFMKLFVKGNFLLAAYLTPYATTTKSVANAFRDAAELIRSVEDGKIPPLAKLTKMQLLCWLTHTMCEIYGYDYFYEALNERALDLYSSPGLTNSDMLELFLVHATMLVTENKKPFDTMLENYGDSIPLDLKMAIFEHSSEHKSETKVLKKFSNNFSKRAKTNISLKNAIENIYTKPLEAFTSKQLTSSKNK